MNGKKAEFQTKLNRFNTAVNGGMPDTVPVMTMVDTYVLAQAHYSIQDACGLQDSLLESNRSLCDYFLENGVSLTYRESDGKHDWDFWDKEIRAVLDWLPLPGPNAGLSSGNVSAG